MAPAPASILAAFGLDRCAPGHRVADEGAGADPRSQQSLREIRRLTASSAVVRETPSSEARVRVGGQPLPAIEPARQDDIAQPHVELHADFPVEAPIDPIEERIAPALVFMNGLSWQPKLVWKLCGDWTLS